jgi:hypothetical protein
MIISWKVKGLRFQSIPQACPQSFLPRNGEGETRELQSAGDTMDRILIYRLAFAKLKHSQTKIED